MCKLTDMRVLIADDNAANLELIEQILQEAGYANVLSTQDPEGVVHLCSSWQPDLLILDLHMPRRSGYEVMADLRDLMREPVSLPVLVLTADVTAAARHRALSLGARDFVTKPIDQTDLLLRIRNLLQARQLHQELRERNDQLDEAVRARTAELEQARRDSLTMLATVAEHHDSDTYRHTYRVGWTAAAIAEALGLSPAFVANIRDAAPLHDIGKLGIPRDILVKRGELTESEREEMKRHVEIGAQILSSACSPVLRLAAEIALTHHERWDGTGYLAGLAGEEIPLSGRITAVADVFDALTNERPYKPAWSEHDALEEIVRQAGRHFDPRVVETFRTLDLARLKEESAEASRPAATAGSNPLDEPVLVSG